MAVSDKLSARDVMIGLDIGSVSLNTVVMDEDDNVLEDYYDYVHGKPFNKLHERLSSLLNDYSAVSINGIALTGTGGKLASGLIGGIFVNEIISQAASTGRIYPDARTVIEIGERIRN